MKAALDVMRKCGQDFEKISAFWTNEMMQDDDCVCCSFTYCGWNNQGIIGASEKTQETRVAREASEGGASDGGKISEPKMLHPKPISDEKALEVVQSDAVASRGVRF